MRYRLYDWLSSSTRVRVETEIGSSSFERVVWCCITSEDKSNSIKYRCVAAQCTDTFAQSSREAYGCLYCFEVWCLHPNQIEGQG